MIQTFFVWLLGEDVATVFGALCTLGVMLSGIFVVGFFAINDRFPWSKTK